MQTFTLADGDTLHLTHRVTFNFPGEDALEEHVTVKTKYMLVRVGDEFTLTKLDQSESTVPCSIAFGAL